MSVINTFFLGSEVRLVLLDLDHELVHIDETAPVRVRSQSRVLEDLMQSVVELDERGERLLDNGSPVLEVGEGAENLAVDVVQGALQREDRNKSKGLKSNASTGHCSINSKNNYNNKAATKAKTMVGKTAVSPSTPY